MIIRLNGGHLGPQKDSIYRSFSRLRVVPIFPQGKLSEQNSPFSRGVIFNARSRFARSTIPKEKCGLLIVYSCSIKRPLLRK